MKTYHSTRQIPAYMDPQKECKYMLYLYVYALIFSITAFVKYNLKLYGIFYYVYIYMDTIFAEKC
jgi:hypothetical protein